MAKRTLRSPLERFACRDHFACVQINLHHIALSGYIQMSFMDRQDWWRKSRASRQQRFELYLAEGFPPLGVGKLPVMEEQTNG